MLLQGMEIMEIIIDRCGEKGGVAEAPRGIVLDEGATLLDQSVGLE